MSSQRPAVAAADPPTREESRRIARRISDELAVEMARADVVRGDCALLLERLGPAPKAEDVAVLAPLESALASRSGPIVAPVVEMLERVAELASDPWPVLRPLVGARDAESVLRGLRGLARLVASGRPSPGRRLAAFAAQRIDAGPSPLASAEALTAVGEALRSSSPGESTAADPVIEMLLAEPDLPVRGLAARVLDLPGAPASSASARALLGEDAYAFLAPYLDYTRAGHLDLLHLAPAGRTSAATLDAFRRAAAACGEKALREVIAELGWSRVALGIDAEPRVAVRIGASMPFFVRPEEAPWLEACDHGRRIGEYVVAVAHGGLPVAASPASEDDPVVRYRGYNLAHAEALREILDVAPLAPQRVRRLVALMGRIVDDHVALFARHADECAILPEVWRDLRRRIEEELGRADHEDALSPDLTRLVLAFEDPVALGHVRTLHGLKRYLHQSGLRLGFRLVQAGAATNRTVDVVVVSGDRVLRRCGPIRYVDFGPEGGGQAAAVLPYAVRIVAEGFARSMLHERESFPDVRIFCYGNEVHYFLTYGTHPALARVDFAPPLQGGMVDLEYYGVSRYELEAHPARDLEAIRLVFRRLGFDVSIERNTRVHARYDKESARDLDDLCRRAESLFQLAPYLMDLDWVLGDLRLRQEARLIAGRAWADRFEAWGALPFDRMLTSDRLGIVAAVEDGPSGEREILWNGDAPYRDRFETLTPAQLLPLVRAAANLGVEDAAAAAEDPAIVGQLGVERLVLEPVRDAAARGEIEVGDEGFRRAPESAFRPDHEAEVFARLLDGDVESLAASVRLARIVLPLERTLAFRTTGSLNGHEVQRSRVPLRGGAIGLHVLRGPRGMLRLALYTTGGLLARRSDPAEASPGGSADAASLAAVLRASGYQPIPCDLGYAESLVEAERLREVLQRPNPLAPSRLIPGERVASGVAASPGRAVGRAVLGAAGRSPEDLEGAVLVAATVRPEDGPYLARAAAVVSTGGGILSHAGLIATQYRKPALIVPGRWDVGEGNAPRVRVRVSEYREDERRVGAWLASTRRDAIERDHPLREGDLVVVDADRATLQVLGQDPLALGLHDGLRALGAAGRRLGAARDPMSLLASRGKYLRARHRSEAVLERLGDPSLARFAVREILLGADLVGTPGGPGERGHLLAILLGNPRVGPAARGFLAQIHHELSRLHREAFDQAAQGIPAASSVHEVLALRAQVLVLADAWRDAADALTGCGLSVWTVAAEDESALDFAAVRRIEDLRARLLPLVASEEATPVRRHALRAIERMDRVLGIASAESVLEQARSALAASDAAAAARARDRNILAADEAGFAVAPLVGWKAANLTEVGHLAGADRVPAWYVVTDAAFRATLDTVRIRTSSGNGDLRTLSESIDSILADPVLDVDGKAAAIRSLWDRVTLPEAVRRDIEEAYIRLRGADEVDPFVAVRSSARAEDTETAAHAGEFDTFLFVQGAASVTDHVRRAWAGLWNLRALWARHRFGDSGEATGGGVIVQRMIEARVSGVVQTVHAATGDSREIVINAGLGLGEGVVSGAVGADQITVAREGDLRRGPLQFRYVVGDKSERVVFDSRRGSGTTRVETLYHQRFRPALEYVELLEIVAAADRLEEAYGYPVDIEFALEGERLWLLQVRPVPAHATLLQDTLERHPLARPAGTRRPTNEEVP